MIQIDFKLKGRSGIYSIFNLSNGKRYIGSSIDLYNRLHEHYHNLRNNKSHNAHLQAAWNKYTEDNFIFNILEYCSPEERFIREQYYIDMLCPEYNFSNHVVANTSRDISEEQRKKISETLKRKYSSGELTPYIRKDILKECWIYDISNWTLAFYCKTYTEAAQKINVDRDTISTTKIANRIFKNKYIILRSPIKYVTELKNLVFKDFFKAKTKINNVNYIIVLDENGTMHYFRSFQKAAEFIGVTASTLRLHLDATKDSPYVKNNMKYFVTKDFIPLRDTAVPIEKSSELLSGNIGGNPEEGNTEISTETKESVPSYSVDSEPLN